LHQVGDLFELNVKLRCQEVKALVVHGARVMDDGIQDYVQRTNYYFCQFTTFLN